MKTLTQKAALLFAVGLLMFAMPQTALAVGTASGTSITNRATVNYQVGGVAQAAIESSPTGNSTAGAGLGTDTSFVVDNKVDLTVVTTDAAYVTVVPGAVSQVLTFTVTNTGNSTQDYFLAAAHNATDPFGGIENFDATIGSAYVESGATAGYQAAEDTATVIDNLAAGGASTVYVVSSIPAGQANGDISAITLTATTLNADGTAISETAGADAPAVVDIVFADGIGDTDAARDAKFSDSSAYRVGAAVLTITKTSAVISDPFNGAINPKAIPGAVIEYTISIANAAGSSQATSVTITDNLDANVTFNADTYVVGSGIQVTAPNLYGGAATALTNAADADEGDSGGGATVTVNSITLNASDTATVVFRVTIN